MSLDALSSQLQIMEDLVMRETPTQRQVWKRKIQELREDAHAIRQHGEYYDRKINTNVRHQKERDELLSRRRLRKDYSSAEERDMSNLADEAKAWQQSHYMVNDLLANGEASLNHLVRQKQQLRSVTRFLGQISDSLGISNATMKIIERRDVTDGYFVLAGCLMTCVTIYFVWM